MKALVTLFFILINLSLSAGEFSKIDQTVRETIIDFFIQDEEEFSSLEMDYQNDIWNLEVIEYNSQNCLLEVSAYANVPSNWGSALNQVWLCVNKNQNGQYSAEVFDHDQIGD